MNYPISPAIRFLRQNNVEFEPLLFEYVEKGGTSYSSEVLGIEEHSVIKTLVFETDSKKPLIVLMHGDLQVSTKNLARHINVKSVEPVSAEKAKNLTGYIVGGTSPFGLKNKVPIFAEKTIFAVSNIYINGGKRGFLVKIDPAVMTEVLKIEKVEVGIEK